MKVDFNPPPSKDSRNLPIGATLVGRVSEDDDTIPGALVRLASGEYVRFNMGHKGKLDQFLVADAMDRAKTGIGGLVQSGNVSRQCNMMLSEEVIHTLRNYGAGNLTAGVRRAADLVKLCGETA